MMNKALTIDMPKHHPVALVLLLAGLLITISGCGNPAVIPESSSELPESFSASSDVTSTEETSSEMPSFEEWKQAFSEKYAGKYELLAALEGNEENYPILYIGVLCDKEKGISSSLVIKDPQGTGIITLASGSDAYYRSEEPFFLEGNIVHISLDVKDSGIHDYKLTVMQRENNAILYQNNETIR